MKIESFKRAAIHNLRVTSVSTTSQDILEGLVIPKALMKAADLVPFERIIVTNSRGDNWNNRIYSFVIPGNDLRVEARGSLAQLLDEDTLICVIANGYLNEEAIEAYHAHDFPIIDVGFSPQNTTPNDLQSLKMFLEYDKEITEVTKVNEDVISKRQLFFYRCLLTHLICGLKVNKTHPDCLHGSAEVPHDILTMAEITPRQSVFVYNVDKGGFAETYAVPVEEKTVMTTGAMANFAPQGTQTNLAIYCITSDIDTPKIINVKNNSSLSSKNINLNLSDYSSS